MINNNNKLQYDKTFLNQISKDKIWNYTNFYQHY